MVGISAIFNTNPDRISYIKLFYILYFLATIQELALREKVNVRWEYHRDDDPLKIDYTGVPFISIGKQRCHQRKDMNQKKKEKYRTEKSQRLLHDHNFSKNRKLVQHTKKKGCQVTFNTKKILSFPDFKIPSNTRNNKGKASKLIKTLLNDLKEAKDKKTTMKQCKFEYIVTFPKTKHLYHHAGIAAGVTEPRNPRVSDFIKKLIGNGCRRVK